VSPSENVLMASVTVIDSVTVQPRRNPATGLTVRPTLGTQTGFEALEQAVLELEPGRSQEIEIGAVEETLFVLAGRGSVHVGDQVHELEPEVGLYLPPGSTFALENPGPETLRLIAVRIPSPEPAEQAVGSSEPAVRRLADQELESATTEREFRIVADPDSGLRSATHFVGYIPIGRAPDHFHTYDEVIYVIDGEGVMHAGDFEQRLSPGVCIQLPARTVHCLENTGTEPMRVVAVFRPAGSPAAAYYPDGTPAYQAGDTEQLKRRSKDS
jgi:mannose-6-phosphate isomerase-like protein (cupin superfamily)